MNMNDAMQNGQQGQRHPNKKGQANANKNSQKGARSQDATVGVVGEELAAEREGEVVDAVGDGQKERRGKQRVDQRRARHYGEELCGCVGAGVALEESQMWNCMRYRISRNIKRYTRHDS